MPRNRPGENRLLPLLIFSVGWGPNSADLGNRVEQSEPYVLLSTIELRDSSKIAHVQLAQTNKSI